MVDEVPFQARRGRGAISNSSSRFDAMQHVPVDDGWVPPDEDEFSSVTRTRIDKDTCRSIITRNESPDIPFELSINPYRGCEHGCSYCFARPTHAYLGLSPGLDFETRLFCKPDAAERLKEELGRRAYRCRPIALGINTDGWQPVERKLNITRQILEVLHACRHPFSVVTKSALVERDMDILAPMADQGLVHVAVSITTLRGDIARKLEPRAAAPHRRLQTIHALSAAGIPVSVMVAPLIPVLTDSELETILEQARNAGARDAGYVLLRLPHEVKDLFREWLDTHTPGIAEHVFKRIFDARGGKAYNAAFGSRMTGTGPYADMIAQRFAAAKKRLGFAPLPSLETKYFRSPSDSAQLGLF